MEQRWHRQHKNKIKTISSMFREIEYIAILKKEHDILKRNIQRKRLFRN